ncbi:unnamed protein product [Victoria cruziana]
MPYGKQMNECANRA